MTRLLVVDASVALKWLRDDDERFVDDAVRLIEAWESGNVRFAAPGLLRLEIINVAGRRWGFSEAALRVVVATLDEFEFDTVELDLARVVHWVAAGLSAYDAAYVAAAEARGVQLVTDDDQIVAVAPDIAVALAGFHP